MRHCPSPISLALTFVAGALVFASPPPAAAAVRPGLTIKTVPALAGLDFAFDGKRYTSDRLGVVRIPAAAGQHSLRALPWRHESRGVRVAFSRWLDETFKPKRSVAVKGPTTLEVGYSVSYRVVLSFHDLQGRPVDPLRVASVTLASSLGEKYVLHTGDRPWLEGARVSRRLTGLAKTLIRYSVMETRVEGSNVVNQAQQRFYIARTPKLRIQLSLYNAHFSTHDLLFGKSIGSAIMLTLPNGRVEVHELGPGGETTLKSLPRGQYGVKVKTSAGISLSIPVALSRNQDVPLKVISYADMAFVFILFAGCSIALVVVRRPHLRTALRRPLKPKPIARTIHSERRR
jgi:hypothetical protein